MNESTSQPRPQLTAVSNSGSGCFPATISIGLVVIFFSVLDKTSVPWLLLLIGLALLFALLAFSNWNQQHRFAQDSIVAPGTITRLWHEITEDSEAGNTTSYYLAYTFAGGQETRQPITAEQCLFAKVGDAVTVRYLPNQPECSKVDWALTLQATLQDGQTAV
ncbi:MAG: DUF3592 domain-containing protein [Caldilineaceae bacterium]